MTQVLAPERKQALLANIPLGSLGDTAGYRRNSGFPRLGRSALYHRPGDHRRRRDFRWKALSANI